MTRRRQHEGSIYKRSDGRWAATVTLGYVGNTRKRKTFYGETRKAVQEQLTKALADLQQGLLLSNERLRVGAFLARWLEESVRATKRLLMLGWAVTTIGPSARGQCCARCSHQPSRADAHGAASCRLHVDAIRSGVLRRGCPWRLLPRALPPWSRG